MLNNDSTLEVATLVVVESQETRESPCDETHWPSNLEVKVARRYTGFGNYEYKKEGRRPREEARYKRYHRNGRQNPAKRRGDLSYEETWEMTKALDAMEARREASRRYRAEMRMEEENDRMQVLLDQIDYLDWWEEFNRPADRYYDYYDGYYGSYECDCPFCMGVGYDYRDPNADYDDSFDMWLFLQRTYGSPEDEVDQVEEVAFEDSPRTVPMTRTTDRNYELRVKARQNLVQKRGRRRRRQSPAKLAWVS
jgi:hypothetical protein